MITLNGSPSEWSEGMTVQDLLDREHFTFKMLSVWINDSAVEKKAFATKKIPDNAIVQVIHNISGG
ncbi:sulfur carrier protein ThiS [Synergistaceae bacterium OttesenSCG-928-D05]|nr:sulfur carrier protein ThiS [Synergistaceae bacterium OttesenSCG-928-D05]